MSDIYIYCPGRSGSTLVSAYISHNSDAFILNDTFVFEILYKTLTNSNNFALKNTIQSLSPKLYTLLQNIKKKITKSNVSNNFNRDITLETKFKGYNLVGEPHKKKLNSQFIRNLLNFYNIISQETGTQYWLVQYIEYFHKNQKMKQTIDGISNIDELISKTLESLVPPEFHDTYSYLGEKTPKHLFFHPLIYDLFPNSTFFSVIRNPISNISSLNKRVGNLNSAIATYRNYLQLIQKLEDKQILHPLRYEDLLYHREKFVDKVNSAIDINLKVSDEYQYYIRESYIGKNRIDFERDMKNYNGVSDKEKRIIKESTRPIIERYYNDLDEIYPPSKV